MGYQDYTVRLTFLSSESGSVEYTFPNVFSVSDPKEGMKATVIHGTRGDGAIVIPGGKKSQEIRIRGKLFDADGYKDLTALMNDMRSKITTDLATLTMKHNDGGWVTDWTHSVRRIDEINFPSSMRIGMQEYEISFLVLTY